MTQQSEQDRYRADRRINAAGLSPLERQRRQVERDLANVAAIAAASEDFVERLRSWRLFCGRPERRLPDLRRRVTTTHFRGLRHPVVAEIGG